MNLIIAMRKFQLILFGCIAVWVVSRLAGCSTVRTFNAADSAAANHRKPAVKIIAGSLTDWPYAIRDIIAHGKTVYIATDEYGLQIMDVSDPAHPSPQKTLHFFEGQRVDLRYPPHMLHIHDQTLYVVGGCFPGRVFALDITDPTAVVPLGTHGLTCGSAIDTTVDKISVADNYSGLLLLDRTDPMMMMTLGYVPRREDTLAIDGAIYGNFAFVRMWNAGFNTTPLYLVEITNPAQTVVRETIEAGYISPRLDGNDTLQLFRHRNQLYQLTTKWLIIRPVAPNAPSRIVFATKELFGNRLPKVTDLFVTDNYLYLIGPDIGLAILDLAKPDAAHIAGAYTATLKAASVLWVEDNLVFIGDHKAGFQILDVTQPSDPQLLYPIAP